MPTFENKLELRLCHRNRHIYLSSFFSSCDLDIHASGQGQIYSGSDTDQEYIYFTTKGFICYIIINESSIPFNELYPFTEQ